MVAETFAVVGDVHGHLQLALCMVAQWQATLNQPFDAVFLCGDVGTFVDTSQLDGATRTRGKENECELEFITHWSTHPPAPWLAAIFDPPPHGMGLACPVVMVHGNHDGFDHLERLAPRRPPAGDVAVDDLPAVDVGGWIRYLPAGWRARTAGGHVVAGVGGMEAGQRRSRYHPMAYVDDRAVQRLCDGGDVDLLITHQGPSEVQGESAGSPTLQRLLDAGVARVWCHGHATPHPDVTTAGRRRTAVVPLGDVAFSTRGKDPGSPGLDGWAAVRFDPADGDPAVTKATPPFWREYRQRLWRPARDGRLVCPPLWGVSGRPW